MQQAMLRVDAALRRHRRLVVAAWAVVLVAAAPFAARQNDALTGGGFEDPHAQSTAVARTVARDFPSVSGAYLAAVLAPRDGVRSREFAHAIEAVARKARTVHPVSVDAEALEAALVGAQQAPQSPVIIPMTFPGDETTAIEIAAKLRATLGIVGGSPGHAAGGGVAVHLVGQGAVWAAFQQQTKADATAAETKGFPVIAILLLVAFGSLAGVLLPLGLGVAAVIMTGAVIYGLGHVTEMSVYVTSTSSLIGIGVAVDYSLFILARYREEIKAGRSTEQARAAAVATSGVAVIFSALTVIASLCGIFLIDSTGMRSIGIGAIVVVAVSAITASALLPVLISLLGDRAHRPGRLAVAAGRWRVPRAKPQFWERWAQMIMRHPAVFLTSSVVTLLVLAIPAFHLRMEMVDHGVNELPPGHEMRQGVQAVAQVLGTGATGPVLVTVSFDHGSASSPTARATLLRVRSALSADPAVSYVLQPLISADGRVAEFTTVLAVSPESIAARIAVERLRDHLPAAVGNGARAEVGGSTAVLLDFGRLVSRSLWKIIVFVLALSFVVLLVLLRSVLLPIKAILMNLLSVAVAYAALVSVFQWGWLEFLGVSRVPSIESVTPPLVLVITFGLSMDYEIFLLTRIRERYLVTGDNSTAVAQGLSSSARTITSAALIMVAVCLAFMGSGLGTLQRLGLATAVAIGVDATIVRLVVVPAAMMLLGSWNWWLPAPLGRILPAARAETLEVEPEPIA